MGASALRDKQYPATAEAYMDPAFMKTLWFELKRVSKSGSEEDVMEVMEVRTT